MKPILYISLRSPFARRTRLLLEELGVDHSIETIDVFFPPSDYKEINPLSRVPALRFPTGEVIVDSAQIQSYFRMKYSAHSLFQNGGVREEKLFNVSAIAMGLMDATVSFFLEQKRGAGLVSSENLGEFMLNAKQGLKYLDQNFVGPYFTGDYLRVCDLDVGAAVDYLRLRMGEEVVCEFPRILEYARFLNERATFKVSFPPA